MKTAMQQAIERLRKGLDITNRTMENIPNKRTHFYLRLETAKTALENHIQILEDLLLIEKDQIIQASDRAQQRDFYVEFEGSEDYFNQTYKQP